MVATLQEKLNYFLRKHPNPTTLKKYIETSDHDEVLQICTNLSNVNGPSYFRLALEGCHHWANARKCLDLKIALIETILENIMQGDQSERDYSKNQLAVVDILLSHLDVTTALSPKDLAKLVETCVIELESHRRPLNSNWLVVLAKLISLGGECTDMVIDIKDPDDTMDGKEWRKRLIRKLCIDNWRKEDATAKITMFNDVSALGGEELEMIIEKACTVLSKMKQTSDENVPPLIFQLLLLTRSHIQTAVVGNAGSSVFGLITRALAKHYNKNHEKVMAESDDNVLDSADLIDDNGISNEAIQRSEGTVIFHLMHAVRMGHPIGKEIMKILRSSSQLPDVITANPFNMFLSLAMTSMKPHRWAAVECLKIAVCKSVHLQLRREENAWFRQTVPLMNNPKKLFHHLIEQSVCFGGWDLIGVGLVDLAMSLLDSSSTPAAKPKFSKTIWKLGQDIVLDVIKRRSASVSIVLGELTKRILSSKGAIQYTDCLRVTIKDSLTVIMEEPPTNMNELLDELGSLGINGARRVLVAIMPLIKYGSHSLRNTTILILRKSLFSPNLDTRRIAVTGVLQLLKYLRITSTLPITQMIMSQSSSCLSQAVINVHQGVSTNNESLCLELLGVLKRGLSQQATVRMTLYQGLHDVVGRNPETCIGVLDMLYSHAVELKLNNENAVNPINVDSMIVQKDTDVFVVEPVGWFLHCVQLIVGKANHLYGDENMIHDDMDTSSLIKLTELLDRLAKIYSDDLDITDLNFEKGADYSKLTAIGRYNILRIETYKNIYEALMDYTIMHGAGVNDDKASLLVRLQKRHTEVSDLMNKGKVGSQDKIASKGKREKENKAKRQKLKDKDRTISENPEMSQHKKGNGIPLNAFNPTPPHAFSMKALSNILHSILNDNKPSHHVAVSQLRANLRFQLYFLRVTLEKLQQYDKALAVSGDGEANDVVLKHLSSIASTLAEHGLFNPEADQKLLAGTLECLLKSFNLVGAHFAWTDSAVNNFYAGVYNTKPLPVGKNTKTLRMKKVSELIDKISEKILSILNNDESEEDDDDVDRSKTVENLFQLLIFLTKGLDLFDSTGEAAVKKVVDWIKTFIENCEITQQQVLKLALELHFVSHLRIKISTNIAKDLAREIHSKVGDVEDLDIENPQRFNFVTPETGEIIFHQIANYLLCCLDSADSIIIRCKQITINRDHGIASADGTAGDNVSECESGICLLLAHAVNISAELARSGFKLGLALDHLMKLLMKLFTTVGLLAKYFFVKCKSSKMSVQVARFDKLIHLIGNSLTSNVYKLITNIQKRQQEVDNHANSGKKQQVLMAKSRALKDGKTIPNLVFKIEAFERDVIKLGKRCKIDLFGDKYPKMSTSRDFRVREIGNEGTSEVRVSRIQSQTGHKEHDGATNDDSEDADGNLDDTNNEKENISGSQHVAESTRIQSQIDWGSQAVSSQINQESILKAGNLLSSSPVPSKEPPNKKLKVKMNFGSAAAGAVRRQYKNPLQK